MKLQDAFDQCLQIQWRGTRGEVTATINGQAAVDYFGGASSLKSISTKRIDQYIVFLQSKGNAPATINRKIAALSGMLRFALHRGELAVFPHIPYQREPRGRTRWLTNEEQAAMLSALTKRGLTDHAQVVEFLVDTGLRPSELWRLTRENYRAGAILLEDTKNDVTRIIPLTQRAQFLIERRLVRFPDGVLFPYDNQWMNYGWNLAKKAIGLAGDKEFVVYALRHTCASRLLQRDVPLHVVQGWLGHTNPEQTMRYAHLSLTNYQRAVKVLEGPQP